MRFPRSTSFDKPNGFFAAVLFASILSLTALSSIGQPAENKSTPIKGAAPSSIQGVAKLQGIVIVPAYDDVVGEGVSGVKGLQIKGPAFLKTKPFEHILAQYLGTPLTDTRLALLQSNILAYCKANGHLIVDVMTPQQELLDNTVQIAVVEAKIEKLTFEHDGRAWFSDSIVQRTIHVKTNQPVQATQLNSDLAWLNNNTYQSLGWDDFGGSFREVSSSFSRAAQLDQTDLTLREKDRIPLRVYAGYDDYGIPVIGEDQFYAGITWANVFGMDQRANFEYVTDTGGNRLKEVTASYVIPLPGRQQLTLFGTYAHVNPNLGEINSDLAPYTQKGDFYQASLRYTLSLPILRNYEHQISVGYDFKRTDTPLIFGSTSVDVTNEVDVNQFTLAYNGSLRDNWGGTSFALQGFYSPGIDTEYGNDADYNDFRAGTKVHYAYGRAELHRETILPLRWQANGPVPENFTWVLRATGQFSAARLLPTEQYGLGGYDTVRGYNERIVNGDDGWLVVNEIRTPRFYLGNLTRQAGAKDWVQGLVFCDYGTGYDRWASSSLDENSSETLWAIGFGVRYKVADNFAFRLDYGFELDRHYDLTTIERNNLGPQPSKRANIGMELAF